MVRPRSSLRLYRGYISAICISCLISWGMASRADAQTQPHPILDATGFQQNRDYSSQAPFENIDTLSGSVVLTFTDLVLPGNAGRELRFQRTYNSKTGQWTFGIAGVPLYLSEPGLPVNSVDTPQERAPAVHLSDGSVQQMAWADPPNINDPSSFAWAISKQFWLYNRNDRHLRMSTGYTCGYEANPSAPPPNGLLRVFGCNDPFNNIVQFEWSNGPNVTLTVRQLLNGWGGSETREVVVTFPGSSSFPSSMAFNGRSWNISESAVTPPTGPGWQYTYTGLNLTSLTTPHNGVISYTYENVEYEGPQSPSVQYFTNVVKTKTTGGALMAGTWTYDYAIGANGLSGITTILRPTESERERLTHGLSTGGYETVVFDAEAGTVPLTERLIQRKVGDDWVDVEREQHTYTLVDVLDWRQFGTLEPATRTVTRYNGAQARTYTTAFTYDTNTTDFGNYHQPKTITETGEAGTKVTSRTFLHLINFGNRMLALPTTEQVTAGGQSFQKAWTYDQTTGFRTAENVYGITTIFTPDSFGNLHNIIRANNTYTALLYQYGVVKSITTPQHTTTRVVLPEGLVESQTQGGRTTSFSYDNAFRVTQVTPPGGTTPIVTEYDVAGSWVKVTRGGSVVTTTLDGLGRPVATLNAVGVRTTTIYDAEGHKTYESYPYTTTNIGTTMAYDALGRVIARTNADTTSSLIAYGLGSATLTDEAGRTTVQTFEAFGSPDDARLVSVLDADNKTWSYNYDALGQLLQVTAPDSTTRTFEYTVTGTTGSDRLFRETHPSPALPLTATP